MGIFGREYDRDHGYRSRLRGGQRYGAGSWRYGEDHGYGAGSEYDLDYGRKSRWQTDYGDPFGDRISHTPMRMIRGDFDPQRYGGGYQPRYGGEYQPRYGGEYGPRQRGWRGAPPQGYSPYDREDYRPRRGSWGRERAWRGSDPESRGYRESRYDAGWF